MDEAITRPSNIVVTDRTIIKAINPLFMILLDKYLRIFLDPAFMIFRSNDSVDRRKDAGHENAEEANIDQSFNERVPSHNNFKTTIPF